jgi:hypothetical protein
MYGRVPLTGAVGKTRLLEEYSTWIYHKMAAGVSLDGLAPATATTTPANTEPVMTAGCATYEDLTHGGLIVMPGRSRPVEVKVVTNAAAATITVVDTVAGTTRALPTAPFTMGPGEVLMAVGGTAGSYVGFLVREELPWR